MKEKHTSTSNIYNHSASIKNISIGKQPEDYIDDFPYNGKIIFYPEPEAKGITLSPSRDLEALTLGPLWITIHDGSLSLGFADIYYSFKINFSKEDKEFFSEIEDYKAAMIRKVLVWNRFLGKKNETAVINFIIDKVNGRIQEGYYYEYVNV